MLPEKSHTIGAVRAFENFSEAGHFIDVGFHDFCAEIWPFLMRLRVSARTVNSPFQSLNVARAKTAALGAGRASNSENLLGCPQPCFAYPDAVLNIRVIPVLEFAAFAHPPSRSAIAMHASRSSSAGARLTMDRATTIPPTHKAAIA